ncbi:MAG: class I SAM-dependent methyltransferase [Candidatus Lindowbacteria bacterium]|nr:class I SAM-dependent methyltransferase [Candidatus Lindowbacteria bacterium]
MTGRSATKSARKTADFQPCNLCGSPSARYIYPRHGIIKCDGCGLVRTDDIPGATELRRLYSESYFQSADSGALGYDDYIADRKKISRTFQRRICEIEQWTQRKGSLLDIGCATGFSLEVARERGWSVRGVEISEFACDFARNSLGLDVFCGSLADADFGPGSFDVIVMWDYIEHCPDPAREFEKANRLLKTGGLLVLTTPDIASIPARVWRSRWMGIKQGEHLYYFSPETVKRLLSKFNFETVRLEHVGKYIDVDFFIKRAGLYSSAVEKLLGRLTRLLGIGASVLYVNPFDIMLVYGIKMDRTE